MFHGSIVALVTPMKDDGEVDYQCFSRLLDWHLSDHVDGIVVLGTTGESATIEEDERVQLIKLAIERVNGKVPVIVGTGANSTRYTIQITREAMELGADAVLIVTPYYNKPTQEGLYQHFKAIAEAVPIPQILYNVPSRTGCDLMPETVIRLAQLANIVGIKDATGDITRVNTILAADCEIDLLSGDDNTAMEFMLAGGKGVISVVANIVPKTFYELCAAAITGDRTRAEKVNQQLSKLYKALFAESNPIPLKWALSQMGMIQGGIRLPLTPLDKRYHSSVLGAMSAAGIKVNA